MEFKYISEFKSILKKINEELRKEGRFVLKIENKILME